jgi:branched-chain amino acid aminotransferase
MTTRESVAPPSRDSAAKFDQVFVDGAFVSSEDARISVRAHALHYGTGTFDGIRGTWNEARQELFLFEPYAHFERLQRSANTLGLPLAYEPDELVEVTRTLLRTNDVREDVYVRPTGADARHRFPRDTSRCQA